MNTLLYPCRIKLSWPVLNLHILCVILLRCFTILAKSPSRQSPGSSGLPYGKELISRNACGLWCQARACVVLASAKDFQLYERVVLLLFKKKY